MANTRIVFLLIHCLKWIFLICSSCVRPGLGLYESAFPENAATMLTVTNTTKPNCPRTCGNLTIPYPFGVGHHCSLSQEYTIDCGNSEDNQALPALLIALQVLDISESQVRIVGGYVASSCDDKSHNEGLSGFDMCDLPYSVSYTDNKFVVTGCHHYGLLQAQTSKKREMVSCVSVCTNTGDLHDGSCSGIGCCQASIPKGIRNFTTSMEKIVYDGVNITSGNCSYAYIVEPSRFKFGGAVELQDRNFRLRTDTSLPLVMDWFVAYQSCREAQRNLSTYACRGNTSCFDVEKDMERKGYRCKCLPGYEGNPYLGCTDIDECSGKSFSCSNADCVNTPGGYTCSCPKGYHLVSGKGSRKDEFDCVPNKGLRTILSIGFGIGLGTIIFVLGGYWLLNASRKRKEKIRRSNNFKRNGGLLLQQHMSSSKEGTLEKTRIFGENELNKATDHFNDDRVLGKGGQGTVYKGMLSDGSIVAIKKSVFETQTKLDQFINELIILSQINHRNIVNLLGCCLETEVPLLVYEYIPNGALYDHLHNPNEEFLITWEMREQIARDIAGALSYLHSSSSRPIFHRDIKTANILLDDKYRAKVSDFGISRSIDMEMTHLTTRVHGTFGYLDPEYARSNQFTEKSDVYSFGVVLVELLTGQKAIRATESPTGKSLVHWFVSNTQDLSNLDNILATRIADEGTKENVIYIAELAKRCLIMDGRLRPTMKEVAVELEVISKKHQHPISFQMNSDMILSTDMTENTCNGLLFPSFSTDFEDNCFVGEKTDELCLKFNTS